MFPVATQLLSKSSDADPGLTRILFHTILQTEERNGQEKRSYHSDGKTPSVPLNHFHNGVQSTGESGPRISGVNIFLKAGAGGRGSNRGHT